MGRVRRNGSPRTSPSVRRRVLRWSVVAVIGILVLDLSAIAKGGFPSKVVGGTSVAAGALPSTVWWFAAGRSEGGVVMDLHLLNPSSDDVRAVVRYFPGRGLVSNRRITVPGRTSLTISTSADRAGGFGGGYPGLSVEVRAERPIVAERTLAFNVPDERRTGISTGPGLDHLVTDAVFPGGSSAGGDRMWAAVFNPGDVDADVVVRWRTGFRTFVLSPRDRVDMEVPAGLASPALEVGSSQPIAVERIHQHVGEVDGVDVSRPGRALASALVPRPFASPVTVVWQETCVARGVPAKRDATILPAGPGVTVLPASPCPVVVEGRTESTEAPYRDVVLQPAVAAAIAWYFAEWGGPGQSGALLVHNAAASRQTITIEPVRRVVLGDQPASEPHVYERVDLAPGQSRTVPVTDEPAGVIVTAEHPIGAWRVEKAHRAFQRSYTDPGFR